MARIPTQEEHPILIPYEVEPVERHTDEHEFCSDMSCRCHEDQEAIQRVAGQVTDGLLTSKEADRYYRGETL
jgi:hypothetical protein